MRSDICAACWQTAEDCARRIGGTTFCRCQAGENPRPGAGNQGQGKLCPHFRCLLYTSRREPEKQAALQRPLCSGSEKTTGNTLPVFFWPFCAAPNQEENNEMEQTDAAQMDAARRASSPRR